MLNRKNHSLGKHVHVCSNHVDDDYFKVIGRLLVGMESKILLVTCQSLGQFCERLFVKYKIAFSPHVSVRLICSNTS